MSGSSIRQEYLETAIEWIAVRDECKLIEDYMGLHQNDENANQLWIYFRRVIEWVQTVFPVKRKEMKSLEWGLFYNAYKDAVTRTRWNARIKALFMDGDVTNSKGVYAYVQTGEERHLSIWAFTEGRNGRLMSGKRACALCAGSKSNWRKCTRIILSRGLREAHHAG